jgi:hypothetical protein
MKILAACKNFEFCSSTDTLRKQSKSQNRRALRWQRTRRGFGVSVLVASLLAESLQCAKAVWQSWRLVPR